MDNAPVLNFARRLAAIGKLIWVRFVLVPGLSDDPADIREIAKFAADLRVVQRVDVLPFHQMGQFKWRELGIQYELGDTQPPSADVVESACAQFRERGLKAW
jgi:pyruvate formate lyase activating enzyme